MLISFIYLHFIYLYLFISIYLVLFAWLFPYKGPEIAVVAVLPPANRCIADLGFEYRYICPFRGTQECAVILKQLNPDILI